MQYSQIKPTVPGGEAFLTSLADNENACLKLVMMDDCYDFLLTGLLDPWLLYIFHRFGVYSRVRAFRWP